MPDRWPDAVALGKHEIERRRLGRVVREQGQRQRVVAGERQIISVGGPVAVALEASRQLDIAERPRQVSCAGEPGRCGQVGRRARRGIRTPPLRSAAVLIRFRQPVQKADSYVPYPPSSAQPGSSRFAPSGRFQAM